MPIYSYLCIKCGHAFDRLLRASESKAVQDCPKCAEHAKKTLTAPAGFDLKGNGWYSKGGTDMSKSPDDLPRFESVHVWQAIS